ncbi:MAG: carboxypeptidase regulatory-like domain-containing protein [Planctomycetota bacterium]|nr:carboxypeptidase regulatory-like domain-containing protein [Planctomycetota bacterium]
MDPPSIEVEVDHEVAPGSFLTPATRTVDGYETFLADSQSPYSFEGSSDNPIVTVLGVPPTILPGDVIVWVGPTDGLALLREVVAVNGTTLTTAPAPIGQAFPNGDLHIDLAVSNVAAPAMAMPPGFGRQPLPLELDLLDVSHEVAHQFLPGVTAVSRFEVQSTFQASLDMKLLQGELTGFQVGVETNFAIESYLNVGTGVELTAAVSKEFGPIFETYIVATIPTTPPIPVPMKISLKPVIGAEVALGAGADFKFGSRAETSIGGGVLFDGEDLGPYGFVDPSFEVIGPQLTSDSGVSGTLKANLVLAVDLYEATVHLPFVGEVGIDGPGVGLSMGPFATLSSTSVHDPLATPPVVCEKSFDVGLKASLFVDYGALAKAPFSLTLSPPSIDLYDASLTLWQATGCEEEHGLGSLAGTVTDLAGIPLGGVLVAANLPNGSPAGTTISAGDGGFELLELTEGPHLIDFISPGYETATAASMVAADSTVFLSQVLVLEELQPGDTGTIAASLVDAQNPSSHVSQASIVVREGLNNPIGPFVTQVLAPLGSTLFDLPAGYYTLTASAPGYQSATTSVSLPKDQTSSITMAMSGESTPGSGEAHVVLTWGLDPDDLDSHLLAADGHCYFGNQIIPGASLDVDDVSSYGPETITIDSVDPGGAYTYYVHHFSGSGSLATSGAVVKLYFNGTSLTYPVPPQAGDYWHVFDLIDGVVHPCGGTCIGGSAPPLAGGVPLVSGRGIDLEPIQEKGTPSWTPGL